MVKRNKVSRVVVTDRKGRQVEVVRQRITSDREVERMKRLADRLNKKHRLQAVFK